MKTGKTITELAAELDKQSKAKKDYIASGHQLAVGSDNGRPQLYLEGINDSFDILPTAHEQLATLTEIPKAYYDRIKTDAPALYDSNVNYWLKKNTSKRMVRTLGKDARALLSDKYRPLDNDDLAEVALSILIEKGYEVVSSQITEKRFYLKAVTPRITGTVAVGDVVQAGIVIGNSEVGFGSLNIAGLLYQLRCLNGMISADSEFKKYHIGKAQQSIDNAMELFRSDTKQANDKAFWMQIRDVITSVATQDWMDKQVLKLQHAANDAIVADPIKVIEVTADRYKWGEGEKTSVLKHFLMGNEMSRYGLTQAITRASQDFEDYDRATEFEQLGGQVLELTDAQWKPLAEARA